MNDTDNLWETERTNLQTDELDLMSSLEIVQSMNREDQTVAQAVQQCLPEIAAAIDLITSAMEGQGRLFYLGAGTSGRLGALDAYEFPPTFGVDPSLVVGVCAGIGIQDPIQSEEAEDDEALGEWDLRRHDLTAADIVIGIAASGRTPYVLGGLKYAKSLGARTVGLSCNKHSAVGQAADLAIEIVVGPEVLSGSTRLKAGTAQKMVLNMLSTGTMVRQGKVYRNYMVHLVPSNEKLRIRSLRMIEQITGASPEKAAQAYKQSGNDIGLSILLLSADLSLEEASAYMEKAGRRVREALHLSSQGSLSD
ncbi:N-acetylmuramic acid 6-phosphate etherase [Paenibacillus eucommiae]|uniref:N-acetylmuramic acid 6-phosphate etherase n=1 Tax=Paenibacillus eucommiae TaxID=1355755 RepID=A0ABS4J0I5_9BACL|nr:N-acetylmuramic acid 6-phosphate etherase [Paenibacillus eucommiae]MBP1993347.1 N-acetylmuramic acid 6-phosphate etherase [Paenibacillus eucommiae]